MATSFAVDIAPMLAPFRDNMLWRLDLAEYEAVKANADAILGRLTGTTGNTMPPSPLPPLTDDEIKMFKSWIADKCPA